MDIPTDLHSYFYRVGGYPEGDLEGWTDSQWESAPVEEVPLDEIAATNHKPYLYEERILHHMSPEARAAHGWPISIVHMFGVFWLQEGHHRCAAAILRGEDFIDAHVIRVRS